MTAVESFLCDGRFCRVETRYETVKRGPGWLIDVERSSPDLLETWNQVEKKPELWPALRKKLAPQYGFGPLILSYYRYFARSGK